MLSKSKTFDSGDSMPSCRSNDFTETMKSFVYKTINAEGDKIKVHNVNHQFELEDYYKCFFY
jgi:hypothetical protein